MRLREVAKVPFCKATEELNVVLPGLAGCAVAVEEVITLHANKH